MKDSDSITGSCDDAGCDGASDDGDDNASDGENDEEAGYEGEAEEDTTEAPTTAEPTEAPTTTAEPTTTTKASSFPFACDPAVDSDCECPSSLGCAGGSCKQKSADNDMVCDVRPSLLLCLLLFCVPLFSWAQAQAV